MLTCIWVSKAEIDFENEALCIIECLMMKSVEIEYLLNY